MSIQAFGFDFTGQQDDPFIDPQTGRLSRNARYLLLSLWNRTGQGTGIVPIVSTPLTATGASIADALQLTNDWNLFETVPAGSGCQILPLKPGNDIQVYNASANAMLVYPPSAADMIDALGVGDAYVLPAGMLRIFECWTNSPSRFLSYGN